jgi:dUTP pyrophosphatase
MNKQSSEVIMNGSNIWTTPDGVKFEVSSGQNKLSVRFKKLHPKAVTPTYAKDGDAGLDLTATAMFMGTNYIQYDTGIAVEIPEGYVGLVFPRSSITKMAAGVSLKNSVGIIDSGYRGQIILRFDVPSESHKCDAETFRYITKDGFQEELKIPQPGERIGQLMIIPYPTIYLEEVDELSSTDRGEGGFGSTGV